MSPAALLVRAEARLAEMATAEAAVAARPEVQEGAALMQPGGQLAWNFTSWEGGSTAYTSCSLPSRTPQYVGTYTPRAPCSNNTASDAEGRLQVLYACTAAGVPSPSTACGNLCDTQNICAALCECDVGCGADQVCQCEACLKVGAADGDPDFVAMQTAAGLAEFANVPADGAALADGLVPLEQQWPASNSGGETEPAAGGTSSGLALDNQAAVGGTQERRLLQSDDAMLQAVLDAVGSLQQSQAALEQQVQSLQAAVADAAAASADTSMQALITAGQQQIVAGQAAIKALLSDILGKQTAAAATAAAQMQVLANLQSLQQQQLAAQAQLEQSAKDQTDAIAIALQQDVITLSQALELYRRVRLQTLVASKAAVLASVPCSSATLLEHEFEVEQYLEVPVDTARVRMLGTSNRLIGGLLLFNQRGLPAACANSRFSGISGTCKNGLDTAPYGVDPIFKSGTSLYNPDLDSAEAVAVYYNCSALATATCNVTQEGSTGLAAPHISNAPPFCAELFSPRSLPYGFHAARLQQFGDGFPVLFDINLDAAAALDWLAFIQEGLYLDSRTQRLLAQVVAYNPELRLFSSAIVAFEFGKGGSVQVRHKIQTLRVELYATRLDAFRLFLEVVLTLYIAGLAAAELRSLYRVIRLTGSVLSYFTSGWHAMDFASTCLLVACCTMWWVLVWRHAIPFAIDLRFDVYRDLGADAAYLALANDGAGLQAMHAAFSRLQALSDKLAWYAALTGINLLMLIARLLQLMDFQPRLGVVTRSLAHAGPDLLHFGLVFGLVFIGYAFLAHLIFGNAIAGFSTFGGSVNTCFALLLGDTAVNSDLQALRGLQAVAGAAFFWTFEVLVFLVLLNFLLAIIVDAFSQVKERTTNTTGLHTEVAQMLRHAWESATSRFSRDHLSDAELARLLHWWQSTERSAADINGDGMVDASEAALQERVKPKALRVQGRVVAEDELRQILQAYVVVEGQLPGDIEASPPKLPPAARLLGSLGLKRATQAASHRPLNLNAPDLDKVAHYVLQRFGDEAEGTEDEERTTGDGSRSHSGSGDGAHRGVRHGKQPPAEHAAARPAPARHDSGDFSIAAIRAGALPQSAAAMQAEGGGTTRWSPSHLPGSPGEPSNGRRLLHAMQTETEQRGAAEASSTLLQLQGSLAATQQRLLEASNQLIAQQASVLQAVGSAVAGGSGVQQSGGSSGVADTGWALLTQLSLRQRPMLRSDSGRAAALLPPGRPPISSARGGGLEPLGSDDGR